MSCYIIVRLFIERFVVVMILALDLFHAPSAVKIPQHPDVKRTQGSCLECSLPNRKN